MFVCLRINKDPRSLLLRPAEDLDLHLVTDIKHFHVSEKFPESIQSASINHDSVPPKARR